MIALITKECRSAASNQFTSVEASCSESTLYYIFRFRTKDKEVEMHVLTVSVFSYTGRKQCSLAAFIVNSFEYTMGKMDLAVKSRINPTSFFRECSSSAAQCLTEGSRVRASPASLRCVIKQDTLIIV